MSGKASEPPLFDLAARGCAIVVPFRQDEVSHICTVNSTGVSKDATRAVRGFFPIIVQLWMTAVLLVFIAVRVLASDTVQNLVHGWASRPVFFARANAEVSPDRGLGHVI